MQLSTAITTANKFIAAPRAAVFAHWTDIEARKRYETPPNSGMRYLSYAQKQDDVEQVEITHDGGVIGMFDQRLVLMAEPEIVITQIEGTLFNAKTLFMQVVMRFEDEADGTRIHGNSQVFDLTGRDIQAEHDAGWRALFDAFENDFNTHATGK